MLVKIVVASLQKDKHRQTNLCQGCRTDSDLKVLALRYANEPLVHIRLVFQKLLQTRQTRRNNKKLSKKGFGYDYALFGKLTN